MTNIIELEAYKKTRKIMSPEQYAEYMQGIMKSKEEWIYKPMHDIKLVIARAVKLKGG